MLIDKYIEEMTKLRQAHGPELEVVRTSAIGTHLKAPLPRLAWTYVGKKCEFRPGEDPDKARGKKVVRV
jgi:hypothetical protein